MQAKKGAAKKPESGAQLQQLGERIRQLREQRGWSQEGFAHEGGLGRSFAGAIERGEKDVRLSTLTKLAKALGVSLSQLLKGIDSWQPRARGKMLRATLHQLLGEQSFPAMPFVQMDPLHYFQHSHFPAGRNQAIANRTMTLNHAGVGYIKSQNKGL
jgi:transcriptional regulator with XRE-family HTH domain